MVGFYVGLVSVRFWFCMLGELSSDRNQLLLVRGTELCRKISHLFFPAIRFQLRKTFNARYISSDLFHAALKYIQSKIP